MINSTETPAVLGPVEQQVRPGAEASMREKTFAKKLAKAGWHTYRDEETGRVVTNAYEDERMKLQKICGLACEFVSPPHVDNACAKIGPRL